MSADSEMLWPPNNSADFESLCLEVWREIWQDHDAQMHGRNGQLQAGVDIYGHDDGKLVGVQCKQKNSLLWTELTVQELESEVKNAKSFQPPLRKFVMATSGPADGKVQKRARELTEQHERIGLFSVSVYSWREIWQELHRLPELLQRLFPIFWPMQWRVLLTHLARLMNSRDSFFNPFQDEITAEQRQRLENELKGEYTAESPVSSFPNRFLKSLSDSPVFLDLARRIQSSRPQKDLPERPTEFYQEMVRLLVSGALLADARGLPEPVTDAVIDALPTFACRLFGGNPGVSRYARNSLVEAIVHTTGSLTSDARKLLDKLAERGLLVALTSKASGQDFEFAHVSIRDFLAATHIASQVNRDGWNMAKVEVGKSTRGKKTIRVSQMLDERALEPEWQSVIAFTAGLLNEPIGLLMMLADRTKDDHCHHRLGLFCRCYRDLSAVRQSEVAPSIGFAFDAVLRIAKRCEHDDAGHRKPWLEWAEMLLESSAGAEHLCAGLLKLEGRYHGWAVPLKVLELFDRVLVRGKVPPSIIDLIADVGLCDDHQWGINTAQLALRLAPDAHRERLIARFAAMLEKPETADRVRIRLAEAVATAGRINVSRSAGEKLIALAQSDSLSFENSERAVNGLVSLLDTSLAPTAAPLLVNHLLNPSSRHNFWLAWRIIGKADREPDSPWSAVFLAITLRADQEDDRRLKLWSAQVLSKHSHAELRSAGLRTLLAMVTEKKSHSWVHAARWLVENGPPDVSEKAREALLAEAGNSESDHRLVATAELIEMGVVGPDGGPIWQTVREAVLREIKEHGAKYGSRLHVSAPGVPKGNVDLELFADNPNVVIKLLHTFNGPSFYTRDRDDPNEEEKRMRHWNAKLLQGTRYWPEVLRRSIQAVHEGADPDRDGALDVVLYAASGSVLVDLLRKSLRPGSVAANVRHQLLDELYARGWRLRFYGRRIEVLRQGSDALSRE